MHLIVLHSPKGGSGKSTLARELAVAETLSGDSRVAMVDLDQQGTTTGWYRRREASAPTLISLEPARFDLSIIEKAFDFLFVDTPPGSNAWLPSLLRQASVVLVPVRPTPDDLLAAAPIAAALTDKTWAFVLSQVPARARLAGQALRRLASLGRVAPAQLGFRQDYPAAATSGCAACEWATSKAATEVAELRTYLHTSMLGSW